MITGRVVLSDDENIHLSYILYEPSAEFDPWLQKRPAVVVCPGGGYEMCSDREADPVAMQFSAAGFQVFVLRYSLGSNAQFPKPLVDLSVAMRQIRRHAVAWHVDADKIAVCGFSAGGHLSALLGTLWNRREIAQAADCTHGENKPNALILGYPVINTTSWLSDADALARLAGTTARETVLPLLDCDKQVGPHTPPSFLFHAFDDPAVAVEDSLSFATALAKADIPFELHVFQSGGHGLSIANALTGHIDPQAEHWIPLCVAWLWRLFGRRDFLPASDGTNRKRPIVNE